MSAIEVLYMDSVIAFFGQFHFGTGRDDQSGSWDLGFDVACTKNLLPCFYFLLSLRQYTNTKDELRAKKNVGLFSFTCLVIYGGSFKSLVKMKYHHPSIPVSCTNTNIQDTQCMMYYYLLK